MIIDHSLATRLELFWRFFQVYHTFNFLGDFYKYFAPITLQYWMFGKQGHQVLPPESIFEYSPEGTPGVPLDFLSHPSYSLSIIIIIIRQLVISDASEFAQFFLLWGWRHPAPMAKHP